jgi:hypothetical protein
VQIDYGNTIEGDMQATVELMLHSKLEGQRLKNLARLRQDVFAQGVPSLWQLKEQMDKQIPAPMDGDILMAYIETAWLQELDRRIGDFERTGD